MRIFAATIVLLLLVLPNPASAKTDRTVGHAFERVWPTAIRHLRVDEGFKLVETGHDIHHTPSGNQQKFAYFRFRFMAEAG